MIEVKYPGKLFILGEFAIMEPGNTAIISAVNRFLYARIETSDTLHIETDYGSVNEHTLYTQEEMAYVAVAYDVSKDYCNVHNIDFKPFKLTLESELNSQENKKYGFGSSGVVIVATLSAILKFHGLEIDRRTLFKLAVVAQKRMNKMSSGGDLAASIYGGLIRYTRYDLTEVTDDVSCVFKDWNHLIIEPLKHDLNFEVCWTKESHDTNKALKNFRKLKENKPKEYIELLQEANDIVLNALDDDILSSIALYRNWMLKLSKIINYEIETEALTTLIEISESLGYEAKVSGSGGGDCGIAMSKNNDLKEALIEKWEENGLEYIKDGI